MAASGPQMKRIAAVRPDEILFGAKVGSPMQSIQGVLSS